MIPFRILPNKFYHQSRLFRPENINHLFQTLFQIIITSALIGIPFPIICCIGLALGRLPRETSGKFLLSSLDYQAFSPDVSCAIHDCLLFSGQAWQPQLPFCTILDTVAYPRKGNILSVIRGVLNLSEGPLSCRRSNLWHVIAQDIKT